jgi:hypothetical protein
MNIPSVIQAGDALSWREPGPFVDNLGNAITSTGGWALTFAFRGPAQGLDVAGTPYGAGWQMDLTGTNTVALNGVACALLWYWQAVASKAGVKATLGTGTVRVMPNIAAMAASTTFDGRSQAEKDLATVQSAIAARIAGDAVTEYTIGSRSLKKEPMSALLEMEARCKRIVAHERRLQAIKNGMGNPGRVGVRFK